MLTDNAIRILATNQVLLQQAEVSIQQQAYSRVQVATGAELALAQAIIKNPASYAPRFLMEALLANRTGLISSDGGTTLSVPITDAVFDAAVITEWNVQVAEGV